ncbi:MAG TPA: hypothetical protein VH044_02940, partial [Polyangiaceae bacterium]|nr:hypothetical protein [Polyangiaceae bacterium]
TAPPRESDGAGGRVGEGSLPGGAGSARLVAPALASGHAKVGLALSPASVKGPAVPGVAPSVSAVSVPVGSASLAAPGSPPSDTLAAPPGTPAMVPPASSPIAAAPADEPPRAPDPDFDPERAYVEIGMINAEGVPEKGIRSALHVASLSQCYKSALRTRGARSTGVATLNLSFDENGSARSAVLTGADFLPGLARCVQEATSALRVGKDHVDQGGGVAEVTLGFREP